MPFFEAPDEAHREILSSPARDTPSSARGESRAYSLSGGARTHSVRQVLARIRDISMVTAAMLPTGLWRRRPRLSRLSEDGVGRLGGVLACAESRIASQVALNGELAP